MSLKASAKNFSERRLSYRTRLFARRLFVNSVGAAVRLAARLRRLGARTLDLAVTHGLDLERAWDAPARARAAADEPAAAFPPFGARDFLFLVETAARQPSAQTPGGQPPDDDPRGRPRADALGGGGARRPRASVIIPVFNQVEFTFHCLRSLVAEVEPGETEIVVVDDASTDETPRLLAHFASFVRVLRNDSNRGFVESCNRGAREARGSHLVFLNNDTVVHPGWLKYLLETIEADEEVGAVGSLLLYPDGRVQEAGAMVGRGGEARHYGWGASPDDRRLNFAREVDYCSGASLLVRRELFERLGGFDARYAPAYYEDVDLCFGVRLLGRKVVYQPLSRLTHFEGVTSGRDVSAGVKQYQLVNRAKFAEKWRETLEREQHAPGAVAEARAADRRRGPRVLVVNDRLPTPDRDAGSLRMLIALKILARWARPAFVNLSKHRRPEYERELLKIGVELVGPADYLRLARRGEFGAAILSRPDVAEAVMPALRRADPRLKIVFDMVDAHFIRLGREHALTGDARTTREAARYRKLETRLARASDLVWCTSADDERAIRTEAPRVPVEIVPTIHELRPGGGKPFAEREGLLFVGNFSHRPNEDGLHFFMREVFPRVRAELPGVELRVVGDYASDEIRSYEGDGVRVLGYVPDLEPLLDGARVQIAPLRFGAGVKGKIGESLAHGLPVVTTSVGAEGMGIESGQHALVADDPAEFASAVARAYCDGELWRRLADGGRRHVEQHFTPAAVGRAVNRSIRRLTGEGEGEG